MYLITDMWIRVKDVSKADFARMTPMKAAVKLWKKKRPPNCPYFNDIFSF